MAAGEGGIDILKYLAEIRNQRANMVDNSVSDIQRNKYLLCIQNNPN